VSASTRPDSSRDEQLDLIEEALAARTGTAAAAAMNTVSALSRRARVSRAIRNAARSLVRLRGERKHRYVGLAIGRDRIVAVELVHRALGARPGRVHVRPLDSPPDNGTWPDLTEAVVELMQALGAQRATAGIALLRPLAQSKVIAVPPLRRRDLRSLVLRNARRYFITAAEPVIADVQRWGMSRAGKPTPAVAACADARMVDVIHRSVAQAGLHVDFITAAPLALAELIRRRVPQVRRGPAVVAVASPGWCEGVAMTLGRPSAFEPWPDRTGTGVSPLVAQMSRAAAAGTEDAAPPVVLVASSEERDDVEAHLRRELGEEVIQLPDGLSDLDPDAVAAFGAAVMREDAPALLPGSLRREHRQRETKRLAGLAAAAVVLLCVAAGIRLWDLRRELEAVTVSRQVLAPRVAEVVELRRALGMVNAVVDGLAQVEASAVHWTPVVAALAEALPDSAYLISMSADGVELQLAGVAKAASVIVPALEASPLLREVSLTAARRGSGPQAGEQFDVWLALERRQGGGG
jgi:Tfp pilus assembly protein PilN